jgi:hypothetical protein
VELLITDREEYADSVYVALVLAPNILRTTSNSLATVFTNSSFESKFVLQLLENLDPKTVDPDYFPKHDGVDSDDGFVRQNETLAMM